jgi:hypothetical protein
MRVRRRVQNRMREEVINMGRVKEEWEKGERKGRDE